MKDLDEIFAGGNLESEQDLTTRISELTSLIQEKYPELIPYLGEMPLTVPNEPSPEMNNKVLKDYYDSLYHIVKNHEENKPDNDE